MSAELECVGFDLGYTLVHTQRELIFKDTIRKFGIDREYSEILKAYHINDKFFMRNYPGMLCGRKEDFMPFFCEKLLELLSIHLDAEHVLSAFYQQEKMQEMSDGRSWIAYEDSTEILSKLRKKSIKTMLISNWDSTAREVLEQNGLEALFDEIVISSEEGCSKPEKEIFSRALSRVNVNPKNILYVGDNYYDDFLGAKQADIDFVLINHLGKYGIEEMKEVDPINDICELPLYLQNKYHLFL